MCEQCGGVVHRPLSRWLLLGGMATLGLAGTALAAAPPSPARVSQVTRRCTC